MARREIFAIKEWDQPPVIFNSVDEAKTSLEKRPFVQIDAEPTVDESDVLGNKSMLIGPLQR